MKVLKPVEVALPKTGGFKRASAATYVNNGVMLNATIDEPRWQNGTLLLENTATNFCFQSENLATSPWTGGTRTATNDFYLGYSRFYELAKALVNTSENVRANSISFVAGETAVLTVALLAGTSNSTTVGLIANVSEGAGGIWGEISDCTVEILSGPGTITAWAAAAGALRSVLNLSATEPTLLKITRRIPIGSSVTTLGAIFYPGTPSSTTVGHSVKVTRVQVEKGLTHTSYIPTLATAVTRAADICIGSISRATVGTYIGLSGLLTYAAANTPRLESNKLLVEPYSKNYLKYSNEFNALEWTKSGTVVGATGVSAPADFAYASEINETAFGAEHFISQTVDGQDFETPFSSYLQDQFRYLSASVYLKAKNRSKVRVGLNCGFAVNYSVEIDLNNGNTVVTNPESSSTHFVTKMTNGWYRLCLNVFVDQSNWAGVATMKINISNGTTIDYTGTAGLGVYVFGAQLEQINGATSYIHTTNLPVHRDADIHEAGIVYTNAVNDVEDWSSGQLYDLTSNPQCVYKNTVYQTTQNGNLGYQPDTNPLWWTPIGPDNVTAAFDNKTNTATSATAVLRTIVVYPNNKVSGVAYLEVNADTVQTSIYNNNYQLRYSNLSTIDSPQVDIEGLNATQILHIGASVDSNYSIVAVELRSSSTVKLGMLLAGGALDLGASQYGLKSGIVDYSVKDVDEFGNALIVQRPFSKRMQLDVLIEKSKINVAQRLLYSIRATPVLWIGSEDTDLSEVSIVYGYYKDFSTTINYPTASLCAVDIEGLI